MLKLNFFWVGFVGNMDTRKFKTKDQLEKFLEANKGDINTATMNISGEEEEV